MREKFVVAIKTLKERMSKKDFEIRLESVTGKRRLSAGSDFEKGRLNSFKATLEKLNTGDNWEISHEDLEFVKELGSGRSGMVFKGLYKGVKAAIKVMVGHAAEGTLAEFRKEFHIMSAVRGPNIVHFFGACLEPRLCIAMEFCSRGSLHLVMSDKTYTIDWKKVFHFCKDMIAALIVLHSYEPAVLHRDLKSPNLLVTDDWIVKLCDFWTCKI